MGALGCEISKNLALVGIGKLIIVDMDTIEISNLSRQMLFDYRDKGQKKVDVATKKLLMMNPDVKVEAYDELLQELPPSVYEDADVIAGGLDSFRARFALNKIATNLKIPYVDGGATGFKGNVQVVIPRDINEIEQTACLRCLYPIPPIDERIYAACTLPGIPRSKEQCVLKAEDEYIKKQGKNYDPLGYKDIADIATRLSIESPYIDKFEFSDIEVENIVGNKIPSIVTVNAVISGIVTQEILKIIHLINSYEIGSILDPPYLEYSSKFGIFTQIDFKKDDDCPVCGRGKERVSVRISKDDNFKMVFKKLERFGIKLKSNETLVTKEIDGSQIFSPIKKELLEKNLYDLGVRNHDVLNITYRSDGDSKRAQLYVQLEEG